MGSATTLRRVLHGEDLVAHFIEGEISVIDPVLGGGEDVLDVHRFLRHARDWARQWELYCPEFHAQAVVELTRDLLRLERRGLWVFGGSTHDGEDPAGERANRTTPAAAARIAVVAIVSENDPAIVPGAPGRETLPVDSLLRTNRARRT